jgi:hypothetical protein
MRGPRSQRLGRLPFKQCEALAILRNIGLMRYVAGHFASKIAHARQLPLVLIADAFGRAACAKHDDHHEIASFRAQVDDRLRTGEGYRGRLLANNHSRKSLGYGISSR